MHAFSSLWQLEDDDELWTAAEEPLPVEQGDYQFAVKPAGWIVSGVEAGCHVIRYQLGTRHGYGEYVGKYGKFAYGSHFPANLGAVEGDFGPDSALGATDGDHWAHPGVYDESVATDGYLRARYVLAVGDIEVPVETILVPRGELCLRVHRVGPASPSIALVEGAAALGYAPAPFPTKRVTQEPPASWAVVRPRGGGTHGSLIVGLFGYDRAVAAAGFRGNECVNAVHHRAVTPTLRVEALSAGRAHPCACLTVATCTAERYDGPLDEVLPRVDVRWTDSGEIRVDWERGRGDYGDSSPIDRPAAATSAARRALHFLTSMS